MAQFTHTNNKGTWNLWQASVHFADGSETIVQYFLPAGKKPRLAQPATAIKPGYEIHEIGERKTPVVSRKITKPEPKDLIGNFIKNAKI